jgi:hypothetical protein
MAKEPSQGAVAVRRTGGAYSLTKAFALLDISASHGHDLIKKGVIQVIRPFGDGHSPKITDREVARLLREGISAGPHETAGGEAADISPLKAAALAKVNPASR